MTSNANCKEKKSANKKMVDEIYFDRTLHKYKIICYATLFS